MLASLPDQVRTGAPVEIDPTRCQPYLTQLNDARAISSHPHLWPDLQQHVIVLHDSETATESLSQVCLLLRKDGQLLMYAVSS